MVEVARSKTLGCLLYYIREGIMVHMRSDTLRLVSLIRMGGVDMEEGDVKSLASAMGKRAVNIGMKNDSIKLLRSAMKGRHKSLIAVEGIWLNAKALTARARIETLYVCPAMIHTPEGADLLSRLVDQTMGEICIISENVYHRLSEPKSDEGVISLCRLPEITLNSVRPRTNDLVLVLDGLESPGNVGTIIRTAEAAGACAAVICHGQANITNPRTVRSSLCSVLSLPVLEADMEDIIRWLRMHEFALYFADASGGVVYSDIEYAPRSALVVGNEKYGINPDWYETEHLSVYIPMMGTVDSLNAGVAASILAYEIRSQFGHTRARSHMKA
jgi:TrmH family RNA methyltransferase